MQRHVKAFKFVTVGTMGFAAVALLTFMVIQFGSPNAEATPAIGQGKPCNACHTSSSPSKGDVKK
jgi:cytochrome c551/c552